MASKFITVSIEIMRDKNLSPNQKFILAEIVQLSSLKAGCFAQNIHFSELIGVTKQAVSNAINELEKKGYIHIDNSKTRRNYGRIITVHDNVPPYTQECTPIHEYVYPIHDGVETKGNIHINIQNNKHNNKTASPIDDSENKKEKLSSKFIEDQFNHLWLNQQFKKTGKEPALRAFSKLCKTRWKTEQEITEVTQLIIEDIAERFEFIGDRKSPFKNKMLSSYLNQNGWKDEDTVVWEN